MRIETAGHAYSQYPRLQREQIRSSLMIHKSTVGFAPCAEGRRYVPIVVALIRERPAPIHVRLTIHLSASPWPAYHSSSRLPQVWRDLFWAATPRISGFSCEFWRLELYREANAFLRPQAAADGVGAPRRPSTWSKSTYLPIQWKVWRIIWTTYSTTMSSRREYSTRFKPQKWSRRGSGEPARMIAADSWGYCEYLAS